MRYIILALCVCGLMGCEVSKKTTPNSTTVEINPR